MTTADRLRAARLAAGLTQDQLARRSRLSIRTITDAEAGAPPSQKTWAALCGVLPDLAADADRPQFEARAWVSDSGSFWTRIRLPDPQRIEQTAKPILRLISAAVSRVRFFRRGHHIDLSAKTRKPPADDCS